MVWQLHCHQHCVSLKRIKIAQGSRDKTPVQLPAWLRLCFVTVYTKGYCHPILAGCDDTILIAYHQGTSTLLKEDEAKGSAKQSQLAVAELCDSMSEDVLANP